MEEIKELLKITEELKKKYNRNFPLDGRLVGDIGEVLVAEEYGLKLYPENHKEHDAYHEISKIDVQIKSTFKGNVSFPFKFVPQHFISVKIKEDGSLEEIYNGPGKYIKEKYIEPNKLKGYNGSYYTLSKKKLQELNADIEKDKKIIPKTLER